MFHLFPGQPFAPFVSGVGWAPSDRRFFFGFSAPPFFLFPCPPGPQLNAPIFLDFVCFCVFPFPLCFDAPSPNLDFSTSFSCDCPTPQTQTKTKPKKKVCSKPPPAPAVLPFSYTRGIFSTLAPFVSVGWARFPPRKNLFLFRQQRFFVGSPFLFPSFQEFQGPGETPSQKPNTTKCFFFQEVPFFCFFCYFVFFPPPKPCFLKPFVCFPPPKNLQGFVVWKKGFGWGAVVGERGQKKSSD